MPTTAIYSKTDGICAWQNCIEAESDLTENIEVKASHCGLGQRAAVPILETYEKFPEAFSRRMEDVEYKPAFDVEAAIHRSREIVAEEVSAR